ncbi:8-oxo-dGTP diphosphatase [Nocardiopsis flavescens]|uniref:8-oxo-dGTP diphosphatase n=1 Tax=Nocardiopsis flavescens TaxID=758803 RepID=A0A1M6M0L6_9ACTN|nr:NUDIX domain-containing protein [Nocardiopsis flavescens]SHJ77027.1 8-oxo-dGTP diphosphatase [Nocardiopsis flavescens]
MRVDDQPRGAVAIIANARGDLLLHLRDDVPHIAWPGHWSVLGGGCDPGESPHQAIVRELHEEAGLAVADLDELFEVPDVHGSGQLITVYSGTWEGEAAALALTEGTKLDWVAPDLLDILLIPPFIRTALHRYLADRP